MATIITVHGTFASGPETGEKWWQKGSAFQRDIRSWVEAGDGALKIEPLVWDGANSETSRREAGSKLRARMRELDKAGERYCVVGHSHGGSVIRAGLLQSAARREARSGLSRWVTVGTPFISFAPAWPLFSRLTLLGKAFYVSLFTYILMIAIGMIGLVADVRAAVAATCMLIWFWLSACQIMAWRSERRLALSGAGTLTDSRQASFLRPGFGPILGIMHSSFLAVLALLLGVAILETQMVPGQRVAVIALFILIFAILHALLVWLHRGLVRRRRRQSMNNGDVFNRWVALRHPSDEAVEGLSHLRNVRFEIFGRDFVVTPITFAGVLVFPLLFLAVLSSRSLINSLAHYYREVPLPQYIMVDGVLVGEGHDLLVNLGFLLEVMLGWSVRMDMEMGIGSWFGILFVVGPILFYLLALSIIAATRIVAFRVSSLLSQVLNSTAWAQIRASAFGSDTVGDWARSAGAGPDMAAAEFAPLPPVLAAEISAVSDRAAGQAIAKLRGALNQLAFAEERKDRSDLISSYLTWDELIHTTYFNVPRFNKLVAYAIASSEGFQPTAVFRADPDFPLVAKWYDEIVGGALGADTAPR